MSIFTLPDLALFANSNDPMFPEQWAAESLAILEENMVC